MQTQFCIVIYRIYCFRGLNGDFLNDSDGLITGRLRLRQVPCTGLQLFQVFARAPAYECRS